MEREHETKFVVGKILGVLLCKIIINILLDLEASPPLVSTHIQWGSMPESVCDQ